VVGSTSADGSTIDEIQWRDRDSTFTGYVEELPSAGGSTYTGRPMVIARLSYDVVAKALPYPVAPIYVIVLAGQDTVVAPDRIARLTLPALDEGPALELRHSMVWLRGGRPRRGGSRRQAGTFGRNA